MDLSKISKRIEKLLQDQGMSQKRLAEIAGVSYSHVNRFLLNKYENVALSFLNSIAEALHVPLYELFEEKDDLTVQDLDGFVQVFGQIYKISKVEDLELILNKIKEGA